MPEIEKVVFFALKRESPKSLVILGYLYRQVLDAAQVNDDECKPLYR